VKLGARTVTVSDAEYMQCGECGEVYYLPGQAQRLQRTAADLARLSEGLLTSSEIEQIRAAYGLSQVALETLIASGAKTVTRWERGTVAQSGAADTLLRVLRDHPEVVAALAEEKGIVLRPRERTKSVGRLTRTTQGPARLQTTVVEARSLYPHGGDLRSLLQDYQQTSYTAGTGLKVSTVVQSPASRR
jgi:putative zinc finger/helix-turn-helix YgiT family protein